jgi:hypothetical protein
MVARARPLALLVTATLALLASASATATANAATPAEFVLDSAAATLKPVADDGGWTAEVGVTNLTADALALTVASAAPDCTPTLRGSAAVPAAQHADLTIHVPKACTAAAGEDGVAFTMSGPGGQALGVLATAKDDDPAVDWTPFVAFVAALVGALLWVWLIARWWRSHAGKGREHRLLTPLAGLDKSWSFADSWVSNLTAAAGLVTVGLGSSDALEAVLGESGKATVGTATLAGAVALALTGAAGVVVLSLKKAGEEGVTIGGLLGGSILAFAAAAGQLWTVTFLLTDVDLGAAGQPIVFGGAGAATLLLGWYALTSLRDLLTAGTTPAKTEPLTEVVPTAIYAAAIVATAVRTEGSVDHDAVEDLLERLKVAAPVAAPVRSLAGRSALP